MFTGIVEELGELVAAGAGTLTVRGPLVCTDARPGDSIAVNGVCLTVVTVTPAAGGTFAVDVMPETLRRSALATLAPGDPVNLERAATATTRLGGHLVQGHVDAVGEVLARAAEGDGARLTISLPAAIAPLVAEKGSIAVDGISLTVARAHRDRFEIAVIPETLARTTLGAAAPGVRVNLEADVLARHVARLREFEPEASKDTASADSAKLASWGYGG
jgi:riboflavin synthase